MTRFARPEQGGRHWMRTFKVAISRYLGMATAAINTLAGMARDKR